MSLFHSHEWHPGGRRRIMSLHPRTAPPSGRIATPCLQRSPKRETAGKTAVQSNNYGPSLREDAWAVNASLMHRPNPEVRDVRGHGTFKIDDAFFDEGFVRAIGGSAALVYFMLCRHADGDQESWPGIIRMADRIGVNPRTVMRAIQRLEQHRLIEVVRRRDFSGRQEVNVYKLLHKSRWSIQAIEIEDEPSDMGVTRNPVDKYREPGDTGVQSRVTSPGDTHVTLRVRTEGINNIKVPSASQDGWGQRPEPIVGILNRRRP